MIISEHLTEDYFPDMCRFIDDLRADLSNDLKTHFKNRKLNYFPDEIIDDVIVQLCTNIIGNILGGYPDSSIGFAVENIRDIIVKVILKVREGKDDGGWSSRKNSRF